MKGVFSALLFSGSCLIDFLGGMVVYALFSFRTLRGAKILPNLFILSLTSEEVLRNAGCLAFSWGGTQTGDFLRKHDKKIGVVSSKIGVKFSRTGTMR